jgi:hypothetical protein
VAKNIVIAVDAKQQTLDALALALGHGLADATGAPAVLVTVFAYHPLDDAAAPSWSACAPTRGTRCWSSLAPRALR